MMCVMYSLFDAPLLTPCFVIRGLSMTRFEYTPRSHSTTSENTQFDGRRGVYFLGDNIRSCPGGRIATNQVIDWCSPLGAVRSKRQQNMLEFTLRVRAASPASTQARVHSRAAFQSSASCCGCWRGGTNKLVSCTKGRPVFNP